MNTKNVKFYLKRPDGERETSIFAKVHYKGNSVKIRTGKSIHPDLWDKSSGQPTSNREVITKWKRIDPTIKIVLDNISAKMRRIQDAIVSYVNITEQAGSKVTISSIKAHVEESLGMVKQPQSEMTLNRYIDKFIAGIDSGKRLSPTMQRYASGTVKNYKGFAVQFKEFQDEQGKIYDFEDIDQDFYNEYVAFFQEKDYTPNTIGRHIKSLKSIMRAAENEKHHTNHIYAQREFKILTAPVESIYLTSDEIDRIAALDLSSKPGHELARDVFLLGCYTALRYSDYSRIEPHNVKFIDDDRADLVIYAQKTRVNTKVPIKPDGLRVLLKYELSIPKTKGQVVNRYIKEIGKWAGLTEEVEVIRYRGSESYIETQPKYELITTHTARRSAATNMAKEGISLELIRRITGHTSEKNLLKYIRLTQDEVPELLRKNYSYFN